MAHVRQQQVQAAEWLRVFDRNNSGRLERDELSELLTSLHPEVGVPTKEALDLLLTQATEIRTYSMHVKGDPNGSVGSNELMAVVSGYAMYILASAAFDRRQCEGVVALRDLPALMKEANAGHARQQADVDFVVDCCNSSLNGSISGTTLSREDLLPAFAAWTKAYSEVTSVHGGGDDDSNGLDDGEEVEPLDEGEEEEGEASDQVDDVSGKLAGLAARGGDDGGLSDHSHAICGMGRARIQEALASASSSPSCSVHGAGAQAGSPGVAGGRCMAPSSVDGVPRAGVPAAAASFSRTESAMCMLS